MYTCKIYYQFIAHNIYRARRYVLQLRVELAAYVCLLVLIKRVIKYNIEPAGKLAAKFAFNYCNIIFHLLCHIPCQTYARPVIVINSKMFRIKKPPLEFSVLYPVLA